MRSLIATACLSALALADERLSFSPFSTGAESIAFIEQFIPETFARWSPSKALKGTIGSETFSYVGVWETLEPSVFPGLAGDQGLVATSQAAHHAISAPLEHVIDPAKEDVVVQYEVKLQKGLECGGAYIKLLSESDEGIQASEFSDKTPYSIMFGPDKCGATNKVHLIIRHKSPKTGEIEEKHLSAPPSPKIDKTTTLYTLHLKHADQSYEIWINDQSVKSGSLASDFQPPFVPPTEIDDPEDKKPEDWVDQAKITDPKATKPADWDEDAPLEIPDEDATIPAGWLEDEPSTIPDPEAIKPEEWDDEEDGDWVPASVPNPKCEDAPGCGTWVRPTKANPDYKGKWYAPLIDNPLYKGEWKPKKIPNPAYYDDQTPLASIGKIAAVGFEIWSMQSDITFDNIYVGSSIEEAREFAKATFHVKKAIEEAAEAKDREVKESSQPKSDFAADFKADPIGYIRAAIVEFYELAKLDPVYAFKSQPKTAAVAAGVLTTLIGMLGAVLTLFSSKPQVPEIKKKSAEKTPAVQVTTTDVTKEKADEAASGPQKRAGKANADE